MLRASGVCSRRPRTRGPQLRSSTRVSSVANAAAHGDSNPSTSESAAISEGTYTWPPGGRNPNRLCFLKAGEQNKEGPPIVFVHGFGVGGYHYAAQLEALSRGGHRCYAVDLLGQGRSWPTSAPSPSDGERLCLSIDTWTTQLKDFIDQHVGEPAYVVGNSLGGYLAVSLAAQAPASVRGLVLINATPFWSFLPHPEAPGGGLVWRMLPFDGSMQTVPAALKRAIQLLWWENLSSPRTVRDLLSLVYSHKPSALDDRLIDRILQATRHPAALDAFASILLAPKSRLNFDQMLAAVSCPIVMAYGRDDPWVVPLWGQRLKRAVPSAVYLELSPSGHCPHHETPAAMNRAIEASIASLERRHPHPLAVGQAWQVTEADGRAVRIEHVDGSARNVFERVDQAVWRLVQRLRGTSGAAGSSGAAPAERSA